MLSAPGELARRPAPARRRRLARAAHAADGDPGEHRAARARAAAAARPSAPRCCASARGQLEDLTVLVGDLVDLARPGRARGRRRPRTCASTSWSARPWSARGATRPRWRSRSPPSRVRGRQPRAARARGRQPAGQRGEVEPAGRAGRGDGRRRRGDRPRPRPRHRGGRPAARLRPLLPRARRRAGCRAPGSGWRSSSTSPTRTAAPSSPRPAPGGGTLSAPDAAGSPNRLLARFQQAVRFGRA